MTKSTNIVETEIDTGYGHKVKRMQERFLKGPIPIRNIARASKLSGQSLSVYLAVHHQTALTRKPTVTLPKTLLTQLGISRDAKSRALKQLHDAGLVRVENRIGRAARVALIDRGESSESANGQWSLADDGMRSLQPDYFISKSQLTELRDAEAGIAMWPLQMAEKSWVDIEEFLSIFERALAVYRPSGTEKIDLQTSFAMARETAARRKSYPLTPTPWG